MDKDTCPICYETINVPVILSFANCLCNNKCCITCIINCDTTKCFMCNTSTGVTTGKQYRILPTKYLHELDTKYGNVECNIYEYENVVNKKKCEWKGSRVDMVEHIKTCHEDKELIQIFVDRHMFSMLLLRALYDGAAMLRYSD